MIKKLFLATLLLPVIPAQSMIWQYGDYDKTNKECRLTGWKGSQPSSGKLTIPSSCTDESGVTYSIVSIADGALDNLTTVTEITVPATIRNIGNSGKGIETYNNNKTSNFRNCPKLAKFKVDAANGYYSASAEGMLMLKQEKSLLNVPALVTTESGTMPLSKSDIVRICEFAFQGNSSVTTLSLPADILIDYNGGFNDAINLATFKLHGSGTLKIENQMLIDYTEVVSLPPKSTISSLTLPASCTRVTRNAFRNCKNLKTINLSSVQNLMSGAFSGSGLTEVSVPATATHIEKSTFEGCTSIKTIRLNGSDIKIPPYFATGCSALISVIATNAPIEIRDAAFKGCSKLENFPFSSSAHLYDSVFYGCGFKEVVFPSGPTSSSMAGSSTFEANLNLTKIDLSAMTGTIDDPYSIGDSFAAYCPKLKTVVFPESLNFWSNNNTPTPPAFGYASIVDRIVLHSVQNTSGRAQFIYSTTPTQQHYRPSVFVANTATGGYRIALGTLFDAGNGASVSPRIFIDNYTPLPGYVCTNATYYVPGASASQYNEAIQAGCPVSEMFELRFNLSGGKLR